MADKEVVYFVIGIGEDGYKESCVLHKVRNTLNRVRKRERPCGCRGFEGDI